ncbi:MAG TPA: MarR family transcriptional regulator [Cellulomonas sp.]
MGTETPATEHPGELCVAGHGGPLHALAHLSVLVQRQISAVADRNGMTPMQARMLGVLTAGPRRMAELAQGLGIEKAAMTGLVDRAESRGLVERTAVPGDRRSIHVVVTDAGATASTAFYRELGESLETLIAALPPTERDVFRADTETIVDAASGERC